MPRKGAKRTVKQVASASGISVDCESPKIEEKQVPLIDNEAERQIAAIRATRDVEIAQLATGSRLLRSYFNDEELQTPALQFFKEKLPNLSVVKDGKVGEFEVQWKVKDDGFHGLDMHASLLLRLSLAYSDCSVVPSLGGLDFSSDAVNRSLLGADFQVLDGQSDSHMLGAHDGLQTPGVNSQRLSIGMTPKHLRQPKPGEMLLSVHGSPLGVYKEENMEAIHESEED